jgi:hypothetical protein
MDSIKWPNAGTNSQFLITFVPGVTDYLLHHVKTFLAGNCCYQYRSNQIKFLTFTGVTRPKDLNPNPIKLQHLFIQPVSIEGEDEVHNFDTHRFQSTPDDMTRLMQSPYIKQLVELMLVVIHVNTTTIYEPIKVSLIFSRAGGVQQGLHNDDYRHRDVIASNGEMLSGILSLMDNTKLDICNDFGERKTFQIPSGSMFLMSGKCIHGGSSYSVSNVRLHVEFCPKANNEDIANKADTNIVPGRLQCPHPNCKTNNGGAVYNIKQLYYHWQKEHLATEGLSLKKFIKKANGDDIVICTSCQKGFSSQKGLSRHKRRCSRPHNM